MDLEVMSSESAMQTANGAPLRGGPPTKEELVAHYPAKFTWKHMKTFVNSGCVAAPDLTDTSH